MERLTIGLRGEGSLKFEKLTVGERQEGGAKVVSVLRHGWDKEMGDLHDCQRVYIVLEVNKGK